VLDDQATSLVDRLLYLPLQPACREHRGDDEHRPGRRLGLGAVRPVRVLTARDAVLLAVGTLDVLVHLLVGDRPTVGELLGEPVRPRLLRDLVRGITFAAVALAALSGLAHLVLERR